MESCGRYIARVMTFEVATHFLKCISCSITPQTPITTSYLDVFTGKYDERIYVGIVVSNDEHGMCCG